MRFSIRKHLAVELAFPLRRFDGLAAGIGLAHYGAVAEGIAFHVSSHTLLVDEVGGRRDIAGGWVFVEEGEA